MTERPEGARARPRTSVDEAEVERFSALAAEWWDPRGSFAVLHRFNPVRLAYIRDQVVRHFGRDDADPKPLASLRVLDIGCGGGLICEPMARLGAEVTGIDPSERNIGIASAHAGQMGLDIRYLATTVEDIAETDPPYDLVLNLEVVEHVADVEPFIAACARATRPGGMMIVATINRTLRSFALAIVGAEYILGWLPRGTHQWEKFVTPQELAVALGRAGMAVTDQTGVVFDPIAGAWRRSGDSSVNYMVTATRLKPA